MGCQSSKTPGAGVPSAVALPNVERALEAANTRNMSCYGQLTIGGKSVEARLDHLHFVCDKSYDITGAAVTTFTSGSKCCFQLHVKDPSGPSGSTTLNLNAKDKTDLDRWVHALKFNIDGGEMVLQEDVGTRLLIVDVAVDTNQLLKQLTMDGIQVVYFDSEKDSTSVLRSKLAGVGNGYASVAFANHGPTTNGAWQISADEVVNVLSPEMKGPFFSFFAKLTGLIKDGGHIDLLACNLAGVSPDFVSSLESQYGVDVAASSNVTGNEKNGGDWIMETDGIDAAKLYFVEGKISQYAEVMLGDCNLGDILGAAALSTVSTVLFNDSDFFHRDLSVDCSGAGFAVGSHPVELISSTCKKKISLCGPACPTTYICRGCKARS
jgi:hypothetical protein